MVAPFILQRSQCQKGLISSLADVKLSLSDVQPGLLETSEKRFLLCCVFIDVNLHQIDGGARLFQFCNVYKNLNFHAKN